MAIQEKSSFLVLWEKQICASLGLFVVHVVFVVLKTTTNFVLQYRKQQIQPIQLIQLPSKDMIDILSLFRFIPDRTG